MNVEDLLVGSHRWRMASMAIEPDGSVLMSVLPSTASAICPGVSSPCGCASGRGGFSAINPLARERSLRSGSRYSCRATAAGLRK